MKFYVIKFWPDNLTDWVNSRQPYIPYLSTMVIIIITIITYINNLPILGTVSIKYIDVLNTKSIVTLYT